MIRDCQSCGGTGRILYIGDDEYSDCPVCEGSGSEEFAPDDPFAVREPEEQ